MVTKYTIDNSIIGSDNTWVDSINSIALYKSWCDREIWNKWVYRIGNKFTILVYNVLYSNTYAIIEARH